MAGPKFPHDEVIAQGLIASGTILAFCVTPMLRFAPAQMLGSFGVLMSGLTFSSWYFYRTGTRYWHLLPALACYIILMLGIIYFAITGERAGAANDTRCSSIQHHMLSTAQDRQGDAAMMQALQCRPQGGEMPAYPPATATNSPGGHPAAALAGHPGSEAVGLEAPESLHRPDATKPAGLHAHGGLCRSGTSRAICH
jgi:hypothetical protein